MDRRVREIRKRIERRRKERQYYEAKRRKEPNWEAADEERYGLPVVTYDRYSFESEPHPLFRKEWFLFQTFIAACLVLVTAILFRHPSASLDPARQFVKRTMETEFQFAAVSAWYEKTFGEPLAFFAPKKEEKVKTASSYAVPASGRILESFEKNREGVTIETENGAKVEAMKEGIVTFAGTKDRLGKTVIIQHADGTETWYGHLGAISVKLYDFVEMGQEVGTAEASEANKQKGLFYFAIKQGDEFIDPIQVISFE
ncbi:peptidase M23 family protein [Geobacillus kaustophilus]|uniref:Peptidase M23 family protein n=1 Tax=Geobacillus kaustophilus TaxID=1462 RepID=A0A0D8BT01_GEOKU|nr:M23 family metallopeptidase [Geobacillus kaustophilus]KJE27318.1 peptidase M23 family protein [Geobacillus kaustophilus]